MRNFRDYATRPPSRQAIVAESSISYTGVILDKVSRDALLAAVRKHTPDGWRVIAHHMTINMGPARNPTDLGKQVALRVVGWALDERTLAVKVQGYPSTNAHAHITVAVNSAAGAKPKDSNLHMKWTPIAAPLRLVGVVEEVPQDSMYKKTYNES